MKTIIHIAKKELREAFRDKRVAKAILLSPMLTSMLVIGLMSFLMGTLSKPENQKIHFVGIDNSLMKALRSKKVQITNLADRAAGEQEVREGKARLVLVFPSNFDQALSQGKPVSVEAIYNPDEQSSQISLSIISQQFRELNRLSVTRILESKGVNMDEAEPLHLKETEVRLGKKGAGEFLITFIPYLLIIWGFIGSMGTASDLVAGEKERNTLETLLISPATRREIVSGKLLTLCIIGLTSSLASILGLVLGSLLSPSSAPKGFDTSFTLSLPAALTIFAVQVPLVLCFASTLMAISTLARSSREAQQRMAAISSVVTMPAIFSQFIGYTDLANNPVVSLIPILNAASCIRKALLGKFPPLEIAGTIIVSLTLGGMALLYASQLFKNEEVLLKS